MKRISREVMSAWRSRAFLRTLSLVAIVGAAVGMLTAAGCLSACARQELPKVEEVSETKQTGLQSTESSEETPAQEKVDFDNAIFGAEYQAYVPQFFLAGQVNVIRVKVMNECSFTWYPDSDNPVRVGYHFYNLTTGEMFYDIGKRGVLPHPVKPGEIVTVEVPVLAPDEPGYYNFEIDMVVEGVSWFSAKGVDPHRRQMVYVGG